jgi:hypothetical protein
MIYVNALIGLVLLVISAVQFGALESMRWVLIYFAGALLAFLTLVPRLSLNLSRFLAVAATGMLFFYFAGFFQAVPQLDADWYRNGRSSDVLGLLFAGFAMIPVLSHFSCRMKCERGRDGLPV